MEMRYTHLGLAVMTPRQLRIAATTCMVDALNCWPPAVVLPEPNPHHFVNAMKGSRNLGYVEAPESWKWRYVRYENSDTYIAGDILLAIRAAIRGYSGALRQDPIWGRSFYSSGRTKVARIAQHVCHEPSDEIMDAQKYLKRIYLAR